LFVPVAFLTCLLLTRHFENAPRPLLLMLAAIFSFALATALEFAQLFFPPRTVKLNDVLSAWVGSLVGVAIFARYVDWFQALLKSISDDSSRLAVRLLEGYVVAYMVFALFPFDFLLSWSELGAKLQSEAWGWFVAGSAPTLMTAIFKIAAEVVFTVPFGVLFVRLSGRRATGYLQAALAGILLGVCIEVAQFFIYSGISQGLSIASRSLGVVLGAAIYRHRDRWVAGSVALALRRYSVLLGAAYVLALLDINRWFDSSWGDLNSALDRLKQVNFTPLYYHYYAGESHALFSLLAVCVSYLPVAVIAWAHRRPPGFVLVASSLVATCVEAGKLFVPTAHPDVTNVLLAAAASWIAAILLQEMKVTATGAPDLGRLLRPVRQSQRPKASRRFALILCFVATTVWAGNFPAFPILVALVLATCAAMVWNRPVWLFAIVPAALPAFDLAPWSGRFFLDEFDALLLVGMAVAYYRVPTPTPARVRRDTLFLFATTVVGLGFAISAARGLLPFQVPDANAFNNYYSPYNALRIVKGAVWAWLLYRLSQRLAATGTDVRSPFAWGMTIGLGLTVAVVVWERVAFSGLWNFSADYRVTGPFSAMHTGGAYVECLLAVATPFLMMLLFEKRHWLLRIAGMSLLLGTTYALMVTFSRNGYAAYAVAVLVALLATLLRPQRRGKRLFIVVGSAVCMLMVAVPIFRGDYAQSRMSTVDRDLAIRQAHWTDALSIRDPDWATSFFGMGIGRFPETSFWRSSLNPRSATYRLENEAGNTYLRLGAGDSIYVEQLVSVEPGKNYVLKLDVRPHVANASVTVPICEKWLLTSYNCIWLSASLGKDFDTWRSVDIPFSTQDLAASPWYSQRPVKAALFHSAGAVPLDIDNVQILSANGVNLLPNGDFSHGFDHWFFSADTHLQWHTKSLFYGVLFDQGWFGVASLGVFLLLAIVRAVKNTLEGNAFAGAVLAAISGFLVVGIFDTLIDSPRFLLLLLFLCSLASRKIMRSGELPTIRATSSTRLSAEA
jgi:VanZ family protein